MPPKLTITQRRVNVGDVVQWEHFSLETGFRATGSRDSSIMAGAGTVEEAHDAHVMVREAKIPKPRRLIHIPRMHITSREHQSNASETKASQHVRQCRASERVAKRPRHHPTSAVKAAHHRSASISKPSPLQPDATKDERIAYYEHLAKYYQRRLQETQQDNRDQRKSLKRERDARASAEVVEAMGLESELSRHKSSSTTSTQTTTSSTLDQPLAFQRVSLKAGNRSSGSVLDFVRDLSVDLRVKHGHAAHSVFDTTRTVLTALGAQVCGLPQGRDTANRFLTERETILFDDQVRRMAEANRKSAHTPREVRQSQWTTEEEERERHKERAHNEAWDNAVSKKIDVWRTKIDYNSQKDLPDPSTIMVGPIASTEEDHDKAQCGELFGAIDGTTFGRNQREVLAGNFGGYPGAKHEGEFGFLTENHTAVSGPRTELWEILCWLRYVRARQQFLGYMEDELTYLYDIPVWVVDNCSGNRAENGLMTMIDIVRRLEYNFLRDSCRPDIGPYVPTQTQSCQHHDSNLVNVQLSRFLLAIDSLLEAVDFEGFHSPFNYGASNYSTAKQAKRVQRVTEFHRRCATDKQARQAYWVAHARLEAESAARAIDSARLQQQQQAEQDSSARSRRARRNRGSAASAIERKARAMSTDN